MDLLELESAVKALPGVLGCVIFSGPGGEASEVQAFTEAGADRDAIHHAIVNEVIDRDLAASLQRVFVFGLETEALFGDRPAVRAHEDDQIAALERRLGGPLGRSVLIRVVLTSAVHGTEAEVVLDGPQDLVVGRAVGGRTVHGLTVLATATLEAIHRLLGEAPFTVAHAEIVTTGGRDSVLVFVRAGDIELVGAALVGEEPLAEVVVRATLDAVNRRLSKIF